MRFQNIGRFVSLQEIDFDTMPNISQIDGKNINTSGSSGSGKSTIFQALEFVLGVNETPTTVLQSRLTKNGIFVELILNKDNEEFVITRSKSDGLVIKTPTGIIEGSNKIAEEFLQKLIGIPSNLLRKVFHKRQNEGGFFVGLTPKESYEFLTETLDLTSWTKKQNSIGERLKSETSDLDVFQKKLDLIESKLSGTNTVLDSIKTQVPEPFVFDEKEIQLLDSKIEELDSKMRLFLDTRKSQLNELAASSPSPVPVLKPDNSILLASIEAVKKQYDAALSLQNQQKQTFNLALNEKNIQLNNIERAKKDRQDTQKQVEALKAQIISIKSNICPTCEQNWVTDQAQVALNDKVNEFKTLISKMDSLELMIATETLVAKEIASLKISIASISTDTLKHFQDTKNELDTQLRASQDEYSKAMTSSNEAFYEATKKFNTKKSEIESAWNDQIQLVSTQIQTAQAEKQKNMNAKALYDSQIKSYESQIKSLSDTIGSLSAEKEKAEINIEKQKHKVRVLNISEQMIKSYVNQLFQGALDQIASRANEILTNIPNAQTMSVSFDSFKETKSGSIKEEITTFVHCDSETKVPLKSLSGGEKTSVELAVDLAVIEMIETHTGKGFDVLVLDEPFSGLDSVSICGIIDMLTMTDLTKKIILVDHNPEAKSRIVHKITAVRDGQESRVET